jgi:hypothetical protein
MDTSVYWPGGEPNQEHECPAHQASLGHVSSSAKGEDLEPGPTASMHFHLLYTSVLFSGCSEWSLWPVGWQGWAG